MTKKAATVRNPLTIIAIFAGIAEVSGTGVLPFLRPEHQGIFMYFLMYFPTLLVLLFFAILFFKHHVLYAPSDYRNDDAFLKTTLWDATSESRLAKLRSEAQEIEQALQVPEEDETENLGLERTELDGTGAMEAPMPPPTPTAEISLARYALAEELVLSKLDQAASGVLQRNVQWANGHRRFLFDGVIDQPRVFTVIEVKYAAKPFSSLVSRAVKHVLPAYNLMSEDLKSRFRLIVAVVTELPEQHLSRRAAKLHDALPITPFPMEIRLYNREALERELLNP